MSTTFLETLLLTPAEQRVIKAVARYPLATNREIATVMYLTDKGLEYHLSNIYRKMDVSNRREALAKMGLADTCPTCGHVKIEGET